MKTLEKLFNTAIFVVVVFAMLHTVTNTSFAGELASESVTTHVLRAS